MPWPSTPSYDTSALDSGGDTLAQARSALLGAVSDVIAMIAMRGVANGIASLGADGKVPADQLSSLSGYFTPALTALGDVTPDVDKLPYFTDTTLAAVTPFTAFARTLVGAANAAAARSTLGAVIGTNVQAWDAFIDTLVALLAEAGTEGVLRKDATGALVLDAAQYITDEYLGGFASQDYVTSALDALKADPDPLPQYLQYDDVYQEFAQYNAYLAPLYAAGSDGEAAFAFSGTSVFPRWKPPDAKYLAETECLSTSMSPWLAASIGTGTASALTSSADRNGICGLKGGTVANDGYRIMTSQYSIILRAGSMCEIVMALNTNADETILAGFHDTITSAAHSEAACFKKAAGNTIVAITAAGGTTTTAGTTFTPTVGVYYVYRITVLPAFSGVRFEIFNEAGASQYDQTLSTNLPSSSTHDLGNGVVATSTATNSPTICYVDRIGMLLY